MNIIKFSDNKNDLSNRESLDKFLIIYSRYSLSEILLNFIINYTKSLYTRLAQTVIHSTDLPYYASVQRYALSSDRPAAADKIFHAYIKNRYL